MFYNIRELKFSEASSFSEHLCCIKQLVRATITKEIITDHITNLSKAIEDIPASNTFNCDETNMTDDPGRKKVIVKHGTKYPELVRNQTKSSTSMMVFGNAAGDWLPPHIVYKASRT